MGGGVGRGQIVSPSRECPSDKDTRKKRLSSEWFCSHLNTSSTHSILETRLRPANLGQPQPPLERGLSPKLAF